MTDYSDTAYSSTKLARQVPAHKRSSFRRLTSRRLPWGNTAQLIPAAFMAHQPDDLRLVEKKKMQRERDMLAGSYKPAPLEHVDFHDRCDHEHYRHAPWGKAAHFWIYLATFGKGGFFLLLALDVVGALFDAVTGRGDFFTLFVDGFYSTFFISPYPV